MDKNKDNEQTNWENSDRPEEQQDRDRGQDDGIEAQEYANKAIADINALTTILQQALTSYVSSHLETQKALDDFKKLSDNEAMELLGASVTAFLKAIPFANQINVNLFITLIATIADICKIEKISNAIEKVNEDILKNE